MVQAVQPRDRVIAIARCLCVAAPLRRFAAKTVTSLT
jgi:hypothetical protein